MKIATEDIPKEPAVRRAWILYQLKIRGLSLSSIACDENVSATAVANALLNPSSHLEEVIAEHLGLKARDLFSDRFSRSGERLNQTKPRNRSSASASRNVENRGAA
tara:strand:- start:36936 stop:37253 length:318 start_codon:yes stop_codon:yes gene_type:complete